MQTGWSERIREFADREYVSPARKNRAEIRIRVGDLQRKLKAQGFPAGYTNQILSSLESERFWGSRGLDMETPVGQPRKHETVLAFRFRDDAARWGDAPPEDPLLALAGILRGAIREGADAFVREMRRDKASAR
jgi:hypothetical protein